MTILLDGVIVDVTLGEIWCPHLTGSGGNFLHDVFCTCHLPVSHMCFGESYDTDLVIGEDCSPKCVIASGGPELCEHTEC